MLRRELQRELKGYFWVSERARGYRKEIEAIERCREWSAEEVRQRLDRVASERKKIEIGRKSFKMEDLGTVGAPFLSNEHLSLLDDALVELRDLLADAAEATGGKPASAGD